MKKVIIFANGSLGNSKYYLNLIDKNDLIICVNGGTKHAFNLHLTPYVVIGDLDSLTPKNNKWLFNKGIKLIKYPKEKDKTDLELALDFTAKNNFKEVYILGAFGTRIDHSLANLLMAIQKKYQTLNIFFIYNNQKIFLIKNENVIKGKRGDLVSLIPLLGDCLVDKITGLKYKLNNETLFFGATRGVSNVFIKNEVLIKIKKGLLLAIHNEKKD